MALLDAPFLARLDRLLLRTRRRQAGGRAGDRKSVRRGQSQEFADHRPYVPGDDLRFLDWHLVARLDTLWIKLFEEETDRTVQVLIDSSASMAGEKLAYARTVAAALAWVALGGSDRVAVGALTDTLALHAPARRGRRSAPGVFASIEAIHPGGGSDPDKALAMWPRHRGGGVALLFTDFLYPDGDIERPLRRLLGRGDELHVFHVLAPAEIRPPLEGDVDLVDAETGEVVSLTATPALLDRYTARVLAWADDIEATCRRLGATYSRLVTSTPVEELILHDLRRRGVIG
jgi:uncharacterized protein (DUF58 family)